MLRAGIVGLPNVGKSTLFNALTAQSAALAANYPFATIEPNVGVVSVPDERLEPLARLVKTERSCRRRSSFSTSQAWFAGRRKVRASAISFSQTFGKPIPWSRWCGVLKTRA